MTKYLGTLYSSQVDTYNSPIHKLSWGACLTVLPEKIRVSLWAHVTGGVCGLVQPPHLLRDSWSFSSNSHYRRTARGNPAGAPITDSGRLSSGLSKTPPCLPTWCSSLFSSYSSSLILHLSFSICLWPSLSSPGFGSVQPLSLVCSPQPIPDSCLSGILRF